MNVNNIVGQHELTNEDMLINGMFLDTVMSEKSVRLQVVLSCSGCYDSSHVWTTTVFDITVKNWWVGLRKQSSRMVGLTCNVKSSWVSEKDNRRSLMAYCLFLNNAIFLWHATLLLLLKSLRSALQTQSSWSLLVAAVKSCGPVNWRRELGFSQLKSTDVYEDNTDCITLANNMPLRGRSKHIAV